MSFDWINFVCHKKEKLRCWNSHSAFCHLPCLSSFSEIKRPCNVKTMFLYPSLRLPIFRSVCPSVSCLILATSIFLIFIKLGAEFCTKFYQVRMVFIKIYFVLLSAWINFYYCFPHLIIYLGEIRYRIESLLYSWDWK